MTRRLFYLAFGAAAGVLAVRRVTQAASHFTPAGVRADASGAFAGLQQRALDFAEQVQLHAAEREHELRAGLGLDGSHDQVDADPSYVQGLDRGDYR